MAYSVIYADPPWKFRVRSRKGLSRSAENHYPTMRFSDITALPVGRLALPDSALFLWVPMPQLIEGLAVLNAWGFTYKTVAFTWAKQTKRARVWHMGLGYWTRANCELCLLGTRGRPRRVGKGVRQLVVAPVGPHSAKPPEVRDRIVALMGDVPRIELFAREMLIDGWDLWGNEAMNDEYPVSILGMPYYQEV